MPTVEGWPQIHFRWAENEPGWKLLFRLSPVKRKTRRNHPTLAEHLMPGRNFSKE
jgi:hypothetical protein